MLRPYKTVDRVEPQTIAIDYLSPKRDQYYGKLGVWTAGALVSDPSRMYDSAF
jgi:hypothetical protein